jgi:hypothetical protein
LLSINELLFIILFIAGVVYAASRGNGNGHTDRLKDALKLAQEELSQATNRLAAVERRNRELTSLCQAMTNQLELARQESKQSQQKYAKASAALAAAERRNQELTNIWQALTSQLEQVRAERQTLTAQLEQARQEHRRLKEENARLDDKLRESFAKDLIGLKGAMTNVVILLDRSESMSKLDRWDEAIGVVETWLRLLPIKRCALVTFNEKVNHVLAPGGWIEVNDQNRQVLVGQLKGIRPRGWTATQAGLEAAMGYPAVDTILLFTDGEPYVPARREGRPEFVDKPDRATSKRLMSAILGQYSGKTNVPINVVAIGDYFDRDLADFLLRLSRETGGAFLGR